MFRLISSAVPSGSHEGEKAVGWRRFLHPLLLIAFIGLFGLCFMVASVSQNVGEAAYRVMWLLFTSAALSIFYLVQPHARNIQPRRALLAVLVILLQLALILTWNALRQQFAQIALGELLLVLPYMLAPTVAAVMVGRELGVFVAFCASLFGVALFPAHTPYIVLADYLAISLLAGVVSATLSSRVRKREQILYTGFASGAIVFVSAIVLECFQGGALAPMGSTSDFARLAMELTAALGVNFIVAVLINGVMPLLEKIFNISTHITWLEWADMNHPLLKKLQIAAPGTFHHSLYVQRLAEAAAEAIGADVTRAGVCGLYHDIGKIRNPQYFAENIIDQTQSPHAELTPEASARIITSHVTAGVEMAREAKLNKRIINVIREHHGVSTAYFFYRKALDRYEAAKQKFDDGLTDTCPDEVDKSLFTYKGPIPQTRESGIVSMADAVESATRSLQHPTEDDIRTMIDGIFKGRILDGHLQNSELTLGEIALMKESFFNTLRTMNHNRIAYPKPREDDATSALVEKRREEKKEETTSSPSAKS